MQHEDGQFTGFKNQALYYQSWRPDTASKGTLIIVHGLGEHSGRYMNLVLPLVEAGYAAYAFDHRGHGRSGDRQCAHINEWAEYRNDVKAFVEMVGAKEPSLPLFLMGHSMGGLIVTDYAIYYPEGLRGVIISAPPLGDVDVSPLLRGFGKLMAKIKPDFSIANGLDPHSISRDPAVVRMYQEDPLVHDQVSARWSVEFFKAIEMTRERAAEFNVPLLMIHGEADELVPIAGSRAFFENITLQADKTYIAYPDGRHESLNDIHHEQAAADIISWIEER